MIIKKDLKVGTKVAAGKKDSLNLAANKEMKQVLLIILLFSLSVFFGMKGADSGAVCSQADLVEVSGGSLLSATDNGDSDSKRQFDLPVALRNSDVTFSREISSRLMRVSGRFNTVFLRLFFYRPEFLSGLKVAYRGEPALLASHFQKVPGDYFVIALRRIVI